MFQLNIIYVASHGLSICNGYIVIVQLFVMVQWMWRYIVSLLTNGVPTTCVYAHA